jgi:excisionase family DNA binding protein
MSEGILVTINDAMAIASVARRTIYHWIEHGRVRYVRTAGGAVRIYAESLFRDGNVPAAKTSGKDAA